MSRVAMSISVENRKHERLAPCNLSRRNPTFREGELGFRGAVTFSREKSWFLFVAVDYCTRYYHAVPHATNLSQVRGALAFRVLADVVGQIGSVVTDDATYFTGRVLADYLRKGARAVSLRTPAVQRSCREDDPQGDGPASSSGQERENLYTRSSS